MIPYDRLCEALDRFNRQRRGEEVAEPEAAVAPPPPPVAPDGVAQGAAEGLAEPEAQALAYVEPQPEEAAVDEGIEQVVAKEPIEASGVEPEAYAQQAAQLDPAYAQQAAQLDPAYAQQAAQLDPAYAQQAAQLDPAYAQQAAQLDPAYAQQAAQLDPAYAEIPVEGGGAGGLQDEPAVVSTIPVEEEKPPQG